MVEQSIFQQSAMIIIQEFSSAAKLFYSRCRLFFLGLGYVYAATSSFSAIFPFSSAVKQSSIFLPQA
jgi:hypothetical protein